MQYILKCTKSIKELYIQEHKKNKGKPTKEKVMVKHFHKLKWPNSLKTLPSGVTNCRNLPFAGGRRVTRGSVFQERNTRGVAMNVYLRKTSEKLEKTDLRTFSERFGSCIYVRGRY